MLVSSAFVGLVNSKRKWDRLKFLVLLDRWFILVKMTVGTKGLNCFNRLFCRCLRIAAWLKVKYNGYFLGIYKVNKDGWLLCK